MGTLITDPLGLTGNHITGSHITMITSIVTIQMLAGPSNFPDAQLSWKKTPEGSPSVSVQANKLAHCLTSDYNRLPLAIAV